jgi:hypothetical protein
MANKTNYEVEESVENALEMLGAGYEPTIEIESQRTVTERRGGKLIEADRPAFVKIYTNFKQEMKDIDSDALKVWLFIALSVNRFSGEAHPGLRAISDGVGLAVNTVRAAVERLENEYNLLQVEREGGKSNKYYPADYVSANREGVSRGDTVPETVSKNTGTVSKTSETVSNQYRKSAQPEEPDKQERDANASAIRDLSIENQIFIGKMNVELSRVEQIKNAIRDYFKLTPFWRSKTDRQWIEWALENNITPEQIKVAARKYGSDRRFNYTPVSLVRIAEHWFELVESAAQSVTLDGSALERLEAGG